MGCSTSKKTEEHTIKITLDDLQEIQLKDINIVNPDILNKSKQDKETSERLQAEIDSKINTKTHDNDDSIDSSHCFRIRDKETIVCAPVKKVS